MAKILDMPKLSPTMEEGVLAVWHKKEGDPVAVDDLLAEVETDKATMEFRAFDKGTLLKLLVTAGSEVKLGQPVAILGDKGEDISKLAAGTGAGAAKEASPTDEEPAKATSKEKPKKDEEPQEKPAKGAKSANEEPAEDELPKKGDAPPQKRAASPGAELRAEQSPLDRTEREGRLELAATDGRVLASPFVRKTARELDVDLSRAHGSGKGGRIMVDDVRAMAETGIAKVPSPSTHATSSGALVLSPPEVRPLSPMRKTIARRLTEAKQTVPHFYLTIDVDAGPLARLREAALKEVEQPKNDGEGERPLKISVNDLIVKACAIALRRVPDCNAQYTEQGILVHSRVDISVAVAVPDGLLTPVVRNADQKSVASIAREIRDLAARARTKRLKPEEMMDGTFSISNLGMFGIDAFSAVINPPEGAILAVGQVRDEAVVENGAIVPGKRLSMTLSCDHRVVDGAVGAAFLAELRTILEHPMRILTG